MVPAAPRAWRPYSAVAELFNGEADPCLVEDRQAVDDALFDRWSPAWGRFSRPSGASDCAG
jgi:hypothetical protein